MRWDRARTGVVTLAVAVAAVASAGAQERMKPPSIGTFAWTVCHEPVQCDLAAEFATGALLGPVREARRSDSASRRLRDAADISIEDWDNGIRRQATDRFGSAAALGALSSVGGQQVTGRLTRDSDHER